MSLKFNAEQQKEFARLQSLRDRKEIPNDEYEKARNRLIKDSLLNKPEPNDTKSKPRSHTVRHENKSHLKVGSVSGLFNSNFEAGETSPVRAKGGLKFPDVPKNEQKDIKPLKMDFLNPVSKPAPPSKSPRKPKKLDTTKIGEAISTLEKDKSPRSTVQKSPRNEPPKPTPSPERSPRATTVSTSPPTERAPIEGIASPRINDLIERLKKKPAPATAEKSPRVIDSSPRSPPLSPPRTPPQTPPRSESPRTPPQTPPRLEKSPRSPRLLTSNTHEQDTYTPARPETSSPRSTNISDLLDKLQAPGRRAERSRTVMALKSPQINLNLPVREPLRPDPVVTIEPNSPPRQQMAQLTLSPASPPSTLPKSPVSPLNIPTLKISNVSPSSKRHNSPMVAFTPRHVKLKSDENIMALSEPIRNILAPEAQSEDELSLMEPAPVSPPTESLSDLIARFVQEEEEFTYNIGTVMASYLKEFELFRKTFKKHRSGVIDDMYESLMAVFRSLKTLAVDEDHLNLFRLKKHVIRNTVSTDPESKFVVELSDVVIMFVQRTLCVGYLQNFLPDFVNLHRPKVQQLLFDSDKVLKLTVEKKMDPESAKLQRSRNKLTPVLTFNQILTCASERLPYYLSIFRDHIFKPHFSQSDVVRSLTLSKFENAVDKLESIVQEKAELLNQLQQMNRVYDIQLEIDLDDLLSANQSVDGVDVLPKLVFESSDDETQLTMDNITYQVYVFNRMLILYDKKLKKKQIYHLRENECTVHAEGETQIRLQFSQDDSIVLKCANNKIRKRFVTIFRNVLEPTFFDTDTTQSAAHQLRQIAAQSLPPQKYYAIPLEELYAYPRCMRWQCFEESDTPYNIQLNNDDIISATLPKLIQRLTPPTSSADNQFMRAFLLTYRSFTTPEELIDLLIDRYNTPPPPAFQSNEEFKAFNEKRLTPIRLRICQILKHWIESHNYDLREDGRARKRLAEFIEGHIAKSLEAFAADMRVALQQCTRRRDTFSAQKFSILKQGPKVDYTKVPKPRLPSRIRTILGKRRDSSGTLKGNIDSDDVAPSFGTTKSTLSSLSILDWPSIEIARQLTIVEYEIFELIQPKECLSQSWNKEHKFQKAPNISSMIAMTNKIVSWVCYEILSAGNSAKRAKAVSKFIKVAKELRKLNNFNACKEIVAGLRSNSVYRLKKTWARVTSKLNADLKELEDLLHQTKNFSAMRQAIKQSSGACLPYIGIFLTDLTFIEDGNKDYVYTEGGKELINFFKRQKQATIINELMSKQKNAYALAPVEELSDYMRAIPQHSEDDLYDMSLKAEAREES